MILQQTHLLFFYTFLQKKPDWAKGAKLKTTGKEAKGDLQTPITNISEAATGDEKLAWVSFFSVCTNQVSLTCEAIR